MFRSPLFSPVGFLQFPVTSFDIDEMLTQNCDYSTFTVSGRPFIEPSRSHLYSTVAELKIVLAIVLYILGRTVFHEMVGVLGPLTPHGRRERSTTVGHKKLSNRLVSPCFLVPGSFCLSHESGHEPPLPSVKPLRVCFSLEGTFP